MSRAKPFTKTHMPGLDEIVPGFPEGGLIEVAGLPGTGKTIFGMSYIYYGASEAGEPGIYVSMIESQKRFLELAERLGLDFGSLMDRGLVKHLPMPTLMKEGVSNLVNTIIEEAEVFGARRLVIDSYTALKQAFKEPSEARSLLQNIIYRIMERLGCTTILIKEGKVPEYGLDFEDYVADGIINLEARTLDDKFLRVMRIVKLRGAELRNPRACFTIERGFRVLPPTKPLALRKPISLEQLKLVIPADPAGGYTTGIPDLDREIGCYPDGSIILFEVDRKLAPMDHDWMIISPTIIAYVLRGRPALIIPPSGVTWRDLLDYFSRLPLDAGFLKTYCKLFYEKSAIDYPRQLPENVSLIDPANWEYFLREYFETEVEVFRAAGKPPLRLIGLDRMALLFGERCIEMVARTRDFLKEFGGILVLMARPIYPWLLERLAPIADRHLKIMRKHGCLLLYGIKPRTPLHAAQLDPEEPLPIPKLIPIV